MIGCWEIVTSDGGKKLFVGFLNIKNMNGTKYAEIREIKEDNKAGNVLFIGHMGYVISIEAI